MNIDVSANEPPIETPEEITEESSVEESQMETTENLDVNQENILDNSETNENPTENPMDDVPTNETESVSETVSGSDVRTDEPVQTDSSESYPEISGNDIYIIETVAEDEPPFLQKPFADYTTTEGLLFIILLLLACSILWGLVTGK